jgi:hypothetical protein
MNRFVRWSSTYPIEFALVPQCSIPISALSYLPIPFAAVHACPRDCSTHVFRARRQSASACRHRQCRMNADKEPCDKTTGRNYPKSALYLVAIACASTFFPHGERTCAGAPCLVSITLARSHVGAIMLNSGLPHFCAILMMRKAVFSDRIEQTRCLCVSPPTSCLRKSPRFDRISAQSPRSLFLNNTIRDRSRKPRHTD